MVNSKRILAGPAVAIALGVIPLAGAIGCAGGAYVDEPVGYAEVTSAPVDIETYPSVVYEGRPVYFYGDRWWYRDGGGHWGYYRNEPAELHRQRAFVRRPRSPRAEERR